MKTIRLAKISTLLAGILFFLGFAFPAKADTFNVTLTKANPSVNVGVCSGAGDWVFTYTVTGRVNLLGLAIKNNPSAGDFCWGTQVRKPKGTDQEITAVGIPAAALNVCGVEFQDTNGVPLNLSAYIEGVAPGGSVDINVDYPARLDSDPVCP
jgi:uncharacterized membrane protein YphA (DoxX/SURF4 family)